MKKLISIIITLLIIISCSENKHKPNFKIEKTENEILMDSIQDYVDLTYYSDLNSLDKDLVKKIVKNNITKIEEYNFKYEAYSIDYEPKKEISFSKNYNKYGEVIKSIFYLNGVEKEDNYVKIKQKNLDSIWGDNTLTIKINTDTNEINIIQKFRIKNKKAYIQEVTYTDKSKNSLSEYYRKVLVKEDGYISNEISKDKNGKEIKSLTGKIETTIKKNNKKQITKIIYKYDTYNLITEIFYDSNKVIKLLNKKSNGDIEEKRFKYENNKLVEISELKNDGEKDFYIYKLKYNNIDLITNLDYYCSDKKNYQNYLENKKIDMKNYKTLSKEFKYYNKNKPFESIK